MDLAFAERRDPFTAERNPAVASKPRQEPLFAKGRFLITIRWSRLTFERVASPSSERATVSRQLRGPGGAVFWVRQESFGPVASHPGRGGRSLREGVCLVVICDQAFDMGQFLVEVFTPLLLFPVARKLLEGNTVDKWVRVSYTTKI